MHAFRQLALLTEPPGRAGLAHRRRGRQLCCVAAALLCLGAMPGAVAAEAKAAPAAAGRVVTEYEVKALYLIRFLDYVAWPETAFANASSPIVIGVLGRNPFGKNLDAAARDRLVQKRPIVIHYGRTPEEIGACHVLFATITEAEHYADIAQFYTTRPVLLVADSQGGLQAGLALEFRRQENTVRFAVSLPNARHRQIELSARLLSSAVEVVQEPAPQAGLLPTQSLLSLSR